MTQHDDAERIATLTTTLSGSRRLTLIADGKAAAQVDGYAPAARVSDHIDWALNQLRNSGYVITGYLVEDGQWVFTGLPWREYDNCQCCGGPFQAGSLTPLCGTCTEMENAINDEGQAPEARVHVEAVDPEEPW